ncbi:hypothetical protein Ppro_2625 [Pelobacter propionicus DSM 2379]|uniref:Uncharacterized protein n=1 Tax=Pelobacter propionicus (strain DSM 2379 / NBRC 103807 / OttBd1) TaxID=338966 RepID=A1ASA9_PELPD|nr:hypothetical protein Ppro_2625 [Pelobacter propionicus DSM 2379]
MAGAALLLTAALMVGVWWYFKLKGRLLARAYSYLVLQKRPGSTMESSNWMALSIDMYAANQVRQATKEHVDVVFNGSRQALIAEARAQGFRG